MACAAAEDRKNLSPHLFQKFFLKKIALTLVLGRMEKTLNARIRRMESLSG